MGSFSVWKVLRNSILPCLSLFIFLNLNYFTVNADKTATTVNSSSLIYETVGRTLKLPTVQYPRFRRPPPQVTRQTPATQTNVNVPTTRKRETNNELPLQKLFPEISINTTFGSPEEQRHLTSTLLNHSLHHGSDDELDRLVFSQLPQGSKLILRTVKIVKTDEDGNEQPMGEPAISFDVVAANETSGEDVDLDSTNEEESIEQDLETDASSHHKASHETYGNNEKTKDKTDSYYHGQDHAKKHKKTLTDTEGKKVTNYKGDEKGLTDFDNSHGNAQSNEGERYKNSKKKNKGRKVTGFKRVYHKEEFQRTEHFYDDEEAKKIAESFGQADAKEKSAHGKKDDKRKYHGTRTEYTDGEKVKNEHSTENGHHKGQHTAHENSDKHRQSQHYNQQHRTPNHYYQPHQQQHPNHNYQAAYSNARPNVEYSPTATGGSGEGLTLPSAGSPTNSAPSNIALPVAETERKVYRPPRRRGTRRRVKSSPIPDLELNMVPPQPLPSEKKIYFAQRDHSIPMELSYYYAPNFGPVPSGDARLRPGYDQGNIGAGEDSNLITEFYNKMGNASDQRAVQPLMKMNVDDRYARNYPAVGPASLDGAPDYYSTILKMNTATGLNHPYTLQQYMENQRNNLISVDKAPGVKVASETYFAPQQHNTRHLFNSPYSNWLPIQSGSSPTENLNNNTISAVNEQQMSSTTESGYPRNRTQSITPGGFHEFPGYHHENVRNQGHPFARPFPPTRSPSLFRRPFHPRYRPRGPPPPPPPRNNGQRGNGNGHYSGKVIDTAAQELTELTPPLQNPPPHHHNRRPPPHPPTFPQFMNGLMNSVAEFFGRLG